MTSSFWTEEKRKNHCQIMKQYWKSHVHWKKKVIPERYPQYRTEDGQLILLNFYPKENEHKWEEFLRTKGVAYIH